MLNKIRQWLTGSTRSYDAAQGGRRWRGQPQMPNPVSTTHAARGTVASHARYAATNNPLASAAIQSWVTQAVGAGIKPSSLHADPTVREAVNTRFAAWTDTADADGRTDWYGIQAALFRSTVIAGEGLAVMVNSDAGLRIRVLDPEQLDASHTVQLEGGARIISGVEFNAAGERVAYWIFDHPLGLEFAVQRQRRRIPAEDILHVYRQDWPGQVRGVSWLAPALMTLGDIDGWRDAMLVKLRTASLLTGFVRSTDGTGSPLEGDQSGSTLIGGLEPGTIKFLEPGQDINFSPAAAVGPESIQFSAVCERHVASSMGLPAHAFGDVTAANYSSLKQATTAFRARVESMQWHCFIPAVCLPVWRRFVTLEVLSGRTETTVDAALPVKHHTPEWPSLEPVKETTAKVMRLRAGLTSHRALLAEEGEDAEQLFREIAADAALATELGLAFPALQVANDNNPAAADEAA